MINKLILSVFGIGYLKGANDLITIILSLISGLLIINLYGFLPIIGLLMFFTIYGIWGAERYIRKTNEHNPDIIVLDEVVGTWVTILISYSFYDLNWNTENISQLTEYVIYALIVFITYFSLNLFKPSLIGLIYEEGDGGLSVVGDDLIAGIIAGITVPILMGFYYAIIFLLNN